MPQEINGSEANLATHFERPREIDELSGSCEDALAT